VRLYLESLAEKLADSRDFFPWHRDGMAVKAYEAHHARNLQDAEAIL
jgi:hypothetical protein